MPLLRSEIQPKIIKIAETVKADLIQEIENQGHKDRGELIKSVRYEISYTLDKTTIEFSYKFYGRFVNDGVKASKVRYPIKIIIDWAKRKGIIKSKKDIGIAFAIRSKHMKEGIPIRASKRFSRNGRRKGFQNHVVQETKKKLPSLIEVNLIKGLTAVFYDNLRKAIV